MKMTGSNISIAINTGLLNRTPQKQMRGLPKDHMVWRGADGFGYKPRGYVQPGAPKSNVQYNEVQIADRKIQRSFLRYCERFNNCGVFDFLVYGDETLITVADPEMAPHFYIGSSMTFSSSPNYGPSGTLGVDFFCGESGRRKYILVNPTALSIAREGRGLTTFLEYPDLEKARKDNLDSIDRKPDTSHAGEIIYKGVRGRKVVAIEAQVNREFSRQNPELVRKNQLFAVWPSEDKEYEAMVREVLLAEGE